jgi:predicted Zn-ribbon and HTH transcriptional regulator
MVQQRAYFGLPKNKVPRIDVEDNGLEMQPMRCPNCGRFLAYQAIVIGAIKVKCRNCKVWVTLDIIPPDVIIDDEQVEETS